METSIVNVYYVRYFEQFFLWSQENIFTLWVIGARSIMVICVFWQQSVEKKALRGNYESSRAELIFSFSPSIHKFRNSFIPSRVIKSHFNRLN